jgi:hypothetical protein
MLLSSYPVTYFPGVKYSTELPIIKPYLCSSINVSDLISDL